MLLDRKGRGFDKGGGFSLPKVKTQDNQFEFKKKQKKQTPRTKSEGSIRSEKKEKERRKTKRRQNLASEKKKVLVGKMDFPWKKEKSCLGQKGWEKKMRRDLMGGKKNREEKTQS